MSTTRHALTLPPTDAICAAAEIAPAMRGRTQTWAQAGSRVASLRRPVVAQDPRWACTYIRTYVRGPWRTRTAAGTRSDPRCAVHNKRRTGSWRLSALWHFGCAQSLRASSLSALCMRRRAFINCCRPARLTPRQLADLEVAAPPLYTDDPALKVYHELSQVSVTGHWQVTLARNLEWRQDFPDDATRPSPSTSKISCLHSIGAL